MTITAGRDKICPCSTSPLLPRESSGCVKPDPYFTIPPGPVRAGPVTPLAHTTNLHTVTAHSKTGEPWQILTRSSFATPRFATPNTVGRSRRAGDRHDHDATAG